MTPPKRVSNCLRCGVSKYRQDEGLGVPEGVAVVAGPRQALGRNGPSLGPHAGLEDMEEGEAHCLLHLGIAVDLDVGPVPEVVQIGALLVDQTLPANLARRSKGRRDLVSQCRCRTIC